MAVGEDACRKRKSHTKSRQGCNCKLRRVKCGEERPNCQKCISFGVACDYESKDPSLDFAGVGSFQLEIPKPVALLDPPPKTIESLIDSLLDAPLLLHVEDGSQQNDTVFIDEPHLALLRKFYYRTSKSIGKKCKASRLSPRTNEMQGTVQSSDTYREVMTREAANHSFVLHALLKFVLMHDRYLYDPLGTKPSAAEAFHGYHATALFSKMLAEPIEEEVKDAMWGASAILGSSTFAGIEATCAQEAWPLKPPEPSDLAWLRMSEGKKEIWRLVDPTREGSAYRDVLRVERDRKDDFARPMDPEVQKLFPYVTKLYNLDSPRTAANANDPYFATASIIERLVPLDCTRSTVMWFLSFIGHMEPEYRELLIQKDPAALLLLSWWYAKLIPYDAWWLRRRALFECQAICIYLDRELPAGHEIRRLLEFPQRVCGIEGRNTSATNPGLIIFP